MVSPDSASEMIKKAFDLAYFIHGDTEAALPLQEMR